MEINLKELENKKMLTRHEVAAYLRVSLPTVNKIIHGEDFPALRRIRRRVFIDREKLDKWLDRQDGSRKSLR